MLKKRKSQVGLALFAVLTLGATACADGETDTGGESFVDCEEDPANCNSGERQDGGDMVWAIDSGFSGWSTLSVATRSVGQFQIVQGVMPHMGEWLPDGEWAHNDGVLAEEPELINEDPMMVEYNLNPDANWGDGNPITLEDFKWHRHQSSGDEELCDFERCDTSSTTYGSSVEEIEQTDDHTYVIEYVEGHTNPEWMYVQVLSYPTHILEENGMGDWETDRDAMGDSFEYFKTEPPLDWTAGPYKMVQAENAEYVIYEPNPDWAGSIQPTLDTLQIAAFEDQDSILTEMRQGEVHGFAPSNLDQEIVSQVEFEEGVDFNLTTGPNWDHLDFNMQHELLQDPALREAIFTAIDVDDLIDRTYGLSMEGLERKTNHSFTNEDDYHENIFGSDNPQGGGDINIAEEILEEAGYEWEGQDGALLTPDGEPVELDLSLSSGDRIRTTAAELIQHYLSVIGIDVNITPFDGEELGSTLSGAHFDMIFYSWSTDPLFTNQPYNHWYSDSDSNYGNLESEAVDEAVSRVRETTDLDEAAELANEAVRTVTEEAFVLPVVDAPVLLAVDEDLVNVRENPVQTVRPLYNMEEWGFAAE